MKAFCMDAHISVIADFKSACPDVEVIDWCLSGHAWVMNRPQDMPVHINANTWQSITLDTIAKFQTEYDSFFKTFDFFIVAFSSCFAMIYEKYNKPILFLNTVRYDVPFCWKKDHVMRANWHECLDRLHKSARLTIVSNNKADQRYLKLGTGLDSRHIPSLCLYTKTQYNPTKPTFLAYSGKFPDHPLLTAKKDLPHPHQWSDVTSFRGVVNFPYEVSLMSVFEHFTAGCPLFFPSKTFWKSNPGIQSLSAYWGESLPDEFKSLSTTDDWIDLADMYDTFQSANTYYFDSYDHLFQLLENFQYVDDREFRKAHIERVKSEWNLVLSEIVSKKFWTQTSKHMSYNRLPLLANVVYDSNYQGSGITPQHAYPFHSPLKPRDVVFVKTNMLSWFLDTQTISVPITLVTGVSDLSPSPNDCERILANPNIKRWIGCNIMCSHPKIIKVPIGVGEPERMNGNHDVLVRAHEARIPWSEKSDRVCIPYHGPTNSVRTLQPTLPRLEFEEYMNAISHDKFVVCQRGSGVDTHRFCEVLLMGSVPVLEHSGLDDMVSQYPCLLVDSFERIDTSSFVWDDAKYEAFLDVFWLRDGLKSRLF
jgi:hypothetical protein